MAGKELFRSDSNKVHRRMGEVINLNKYRRDRRRDQGPALPFVIPAKIEPKVGEMYEESIGQLQDLRDKSSIGALNLPRSAAKNDDLKKGGPETP